MRKTNFIAILLVCALLSSCSASTNVEKESSINSTATSSSEGVSSNTPTLYEEMWEELYLYLKNHNDTSKNFKEIVIEGGEHGVHFNVNLEAYETFTFAAVTCSTVNAVRNLVEKHEIEEFQINVSSPILDTKYFIIWKATALDGGILTDRGPNDDYTEYCSLEDMLSRYGYEDYEGNLDDYLDSKKIPTELIAPFQGEWKKKKGNYSIIISGERVNSVHYGILDNKDKVSNVHTFYFALNNEEELIVVNPYQQPRYLLTINENDELIKYDIDENSKINANKEPEVFKKVSDNTSVPTPTI